MNPWKKCSGFLRIPEKADRQTANILPESQTQFIWHSWRSTGYRQNEQTGDIPGGDLAGISPFFTGYEIKAGSHLQKAVFWCMIHAEGSAHKMWRKWIGIELGDHCYTHCKPRLEKVVDGMDQGGISKAVNWQGGGGFKFYELAPSLLKKDKYGQFVIDKENYNPEMLAAAVAKINGYRYHPDEEVFWKQGKSTESSYIFTTDQYVTAQYVDMLASELAKDERLLICCPAFDSGLNNSYENIILKKIPESVWGKCKFGVQNYNMNIIELNDFDEVEEDEI